MTTNILFLPVKSTPAKLQALTTVAAHCFASKVPLLFSVVTNEAAQFIDELLWKAPPESFLPHAILRHPAPELIAITATLENFNQARVLFNLRPEPHPLVTAFSYVYELLDETHPDKLVQSQLRKDAYQKLGLQVNM